MGILAVQATSALPIDAGCSMKGDRNHGTSVRATFSLRILSWANRAIGVGCRVLTTIFTLIGAASNAVPVILENA